jgi:hypothetical protein
MPKKFKGGNSRAEEARDRKNEVKKAVKAAAEKKVAVS